MRPHSAGLPATSAGERKRANMLRMKNGTAADLAAKCHGTAPAKREFWNGPTADYAAMPASFRGSRATRVLVTSRERGWRAPSGKRAAGAPNTTLKAALSLGADRTGYVTADGRNYRQRIDAETLEHGLGVSDADPAIPTTDVPDPKPAPDPVTRSQILAARRKRAVALDGSGRPIITD